jgi:hypothetical protein
MKYLSTLFLVFASFLLAQSQSGIRPAELIGNAKAEGLGFESATLFNAHSNRQNVDLQDLEVYQLLDLQPQQLNSLVRRQPQQLSLALPADFRSGSLELELVQVDIGHEFPVKEASHGRPVEVDRGLHYRGIVKGDPGSIVAISLFDEEVMGLVSTSADGNMVLGKLEGRNDNLFILYPERALPQIFDLDCGTPDDEVVYTQKDLTARPINRALSDCVRLYFEVDHDIYLNKGGTQGAINYTTGIFNQVSALYANESINTVISEIVVWDVTSPFSSNSSSGMLNDFQAYHNNSSWNGDLGQLLSYQASGGIAAGFSGICNSFRDASLSFSSITTSYATVPTYSWTIMVVTHEFGHLFGSRHTHACVWNGNGTAIDGCAGGTEGSCSLPGIPSVGGTIMSYCHQTSVGINFNEGFGPQPGNVIRNIISNATCLIPCGPPTCTDGIQNGNETGVDCGGPDCPACPTCFDGIQNGDELGVDCGGPDCPSCPCNIDLELTIVLDNYPGETTWQVADGNGGVWASGGSYNGFTPGTTVVESICLPDGCYTFTIYDSYGDGICCAYGNGSYQLVNTGDGTVLASGGQFGSQESTPFCVTGATCFDGIQNGDEQGVDCGGSNCPPCAAVCSENELTLEINFDLLPSQVTWDFVDAAGNIVLDGGPYDNSYSNDTAIEIACLPDGCYEFTMYDSGGNGLCCRFGGGNYVLTENASGDILAAGSTYTFFQTTSFCLSGGSGATCTDGIQNGDEEGVDCGGSSCPPCGPTPSCSDGIQNGDEEGVDCGGSFCPDCPTCFDGIQNGDEEGVDCGGSNCQPCSPTPTCNDGIQNGDEEGVDCGGSNCPACPTCFDGIQNGDEEGVDCGGSNCPACPTCFDGIQNGDEEGVDCGGSNCPACPTCFDGIQNGDEEDVDCGGSNCPACPTCFDGIQNGDEEDVDCGGSDCPACVSCDDGVQNGNEEGVDCGGPDCLPCFTCDDGIQNGEETGVDCGGSICPICPGSCNFELSLTLNFDLLPNQTSWEITNVLGDVFYSGGTYNNQSGFSTITVDGLCFDAGCYYLTIFDSGNNGMCCRFGSGSYTLEDANGNVLAQGGDFDAEETTQFCLGQSLQLSNTPELRMQKTAQLELFPNPASNMLNVELSATSLAGTAEIYTTSITGQLMDRIEVEVENGTASTQLELNAYPSGIYFIHMYDESGVLISKRFAVQR